MAKKNRSIGLKKIEVGEVQQSGMPATMDQLGNTLRGSANFTTEQDTVQDFYSEEQGNVPEESITTEAGLKNLTFNIMEWDNATLVKVFGGTTVTEETIIDGVDYGEVEKYVAPSDTVQVKMAVRALTPYNQVIEIPNALIIARFVWALTRTEIAQVEIVARALAPNDPADGPYRTYKLPAPVTP